MKLFKITYRFAVAASVMFLALSCDQMELDLPSSKVSLRLCDISGDVLPHNRSGETVYQERLGEDLWFTATVYDNPVSTEPSFSTLNGSKQFNVYAENQSGPADVLFNNACFNSNGTEWVPAASTGWPEYATNWYCWAPDSIATLNQNDKTFTYSTPAINISSGTDILVSTVKNVAARKNSTLDITFKHALCEVKIVSDIAAQTDVLESISISGINLTGTYDFVNEIWTDQKNSGDITLRDDIQAQTLFVIPQTLPESTTARLIVQYQGMDPVTIPLPSDFSFPAGKVVTLSLKKAFYGFALVEPMDNVQTFYDFKNETEPMTHLIPIKSFLFAGEEKYADWEIESYQIGTAPAVNVKGNAFSVGGYTVSKSGDETLSVTSGIRTMESLGDNAHWTNPSLTGDTDGKGWSPEDWGNGHIFNDGKTYGDPSNPIDLSKFDFTNDKIAHAMYTANTYIIRHAGTYKLPLVYGNAIIDDHIDFESFSPKITTTADDGLLKFVNCFDEEIYDACIENNDGDLPTGAAVIWQSHDNVIRNVRIVGNKAKHGESYSPLNEDGYCTVRYIQFTIDQNTICQNNALICIYRDKDGDNSYDEGEAIWSWHIWITNDPALLESPVPVTNFNNVTYEFFPLYALGWTDGPICPERDPVKIILKQKASGKQIVIDVYSPELRHNGSCTYYQYGRKDPMLDGISAPEKGHYTILKQCARSIGEGISSPATFFASGEYDWCLDTYNNLWTGKYNLISGAVDQTADMNKTIYDPSPLGYKVPASMAFAAFTSARTNAGANNNNFWNLANPNYEFGWTFNADNPFTIYFPASGYVCNSGGLIKGDGILGRYSAIGLENVKNSTCYENDVVCFDFSKYSVNPYYISYRSEGLALRPVFDPDVYHHIHY